MRQIVLSDFTADMLAQRDRERGDRHATAMATHREQVDAREKRVQRDYEAGVEKHKETTARWESGGFGSRLSIGLVKASALLRLFGLSLLVGLIGWATGALVGDVELSLMLGGIGAVATAAICFFSAGLIRPAAPTLKSIERRHPVPREPIRARADDDDSIWEAGSVGEQIATNRLAGILGNEWVLLSGYYGPGGEIDRLLVGPAGVCAIEVKHLNGRVHATRDRWQMDKYDKYGNLVERGRVVANNAGLSPGQQINRAVEPLQRFLASRSAVSRIERAVVLTHERSQVGHRDDFTIDHLGLAKDLTPAKLFPQARGLDSAAVESVVALVQRDHAFHANRRKNRRPRRNKRGSRSSGGQVRQSSG